MAKRRRWEEELEREGKPQLARQLADLDEGRRAGVLAELQQGGNRALQRVVGASQLQRETATSAQPERETRTYMSVKGIPGPVTSQARRGQFDVLKFSHKVVSPRESASGQASGKRQHTAATVILPTSEGTVPFREAISQNTVLPEVIIYRPSQTITMTNVSVSEIEDLDEDQVLLKLVYEKITWSTPGKGDGQEYKDSWVSPNQ